MDSRELACGARRCDAAAGKARSEHAGQARRDSGYRKGLAIGRPQWLLRPGDLVPVRFVINTTPQGYYVPVNAITLKNDAHIIFAVVGGKAKQIPISVHDTYGELRRIEGAALKTGLQVVIGGVHYVSEGDRLSVVGEERLVK